MRTRSCSRLGACVLAAALAIACQRERETPEEHEVKAAIQRYNQVLVQCFHASNVEALGTVAGENEVARVSSVISGLASQGSFMEARQASLEFADVRVERDRAEARTRERWVYEHRALAEPTRSSPEKQLAYRMTYRLNRIHGAWKVVEAIDEEHPPARIRR